MIDTSEAVLRGQTRSEKLPTAQVVNQPLPSASQSTPVQAAQLQPAEFGGTGDISDAAYAEAMAEIEEARADKGLWARCFAQAGGDEAKPGEKPRKHVGVAEIAAQGKAQDEPDRSAAD